jgi:hypothetical protein
VTLQKLDIEFDKNMSGTGSDVSLKLRSQENSTVSICIIDQSVEFIRKPNELTDGMIEAFLYNSKLSQSYPSFIDYEHRSMFKKAVSDILLMPSFSSGFWEKSPELLEFNVE